MLKNRTNFMLQKLLRHLPAAVPNAQGDKKSQMSRSAEMASDPCW